MVSFLDLSYELRRIIYSQALVDTNVSYGKDSEARDAKAVVEISAIRPKYCTSLLTINRQVSEEALEVFYANAFVAVRGSGFNDLQEVSWKQFPIKYVADAALQGTLSLKLPVQLQVFGAEDIVADPPEDDAIFGEGTPISLLSTLVLS